VKYLKIDRSFITKMDVKPRHLAVVSTILSLARSLNMVAIAEGVETPGELHELFRLGCQQFQGFIAAKPMPAEEFRSLIAASGGAIMPPLAIVSELAKLAREAMRNAVRHGRARSIIVELKDAGQNWQLEISDDGVGLPSDFTRHGGLGLHSMRHRAARLRGTFEIVRLEPRGTHSFEFSGRSVRRIRGAEGGPLPNKLPSTRAGCCD
jgi:anti-sigma regulatory factor (Ser/Thr protein kinase)